MVASVVGVVCSGIYDPVVSREIMPGVLSQDLMTVAAALTLVILAGTTREEDMRRKIVILGLLGYLFYAYGIYVIEQIYTVLYLTYMALFGLSFYSLVYGLVTIDRDIFPRVSLARRPRLVSTAFLFLVPLIFYPLWISQLLPLIRTGRKIEFLNSVYILDLCFIMPAFVILGVWTARNRGTGLLLTPAMFVLGFTLLFPVGVGELFKPYYDQAVDPAGLGLFLGLSLLFVLLAGVHFRKLEIPAGNGLSRAQ